MANEKVGVDITANPTGFEAGMDRVNRSMKAVFDSTNFAGEAFSKLQSKMVMVAGVVAGGKFFKAAIDETQKLTGEMLSLGKRLGLTGEEAGALNTALNDIGSDADTYIGAFDKFAKQLRTNEDGLQAMGLKTRDSNGDLRDSNELFMEAVRTIGEYKPGLDQTTAAQTLFGKSVEDVMKLQRLSTEAIEQAKEKNEELGLSLTQEGVAASKAYKAAMNDVGDVLLGVQNAIGRAVMPILTQLAEWFSGVGPSAVFVFKVAIDAVATALHAVVFVAKTVWNVLRALADPLFTFGSAIRKLIEGDMSGATAEMMKMGENWGKSLSDVFDKVKADATRTWSEVGDLWGKGTAVSAPVGGTKRMGDFGGTNERKVGTAESGLMAQLEADLLQKKAALEKEGALEGQYRELSKAAELAFWQDKLTLQNLSQKESAAITRKVAEVEIGTVRENLDAKLSALKTEAAEYKTNTEEKLRIERQIQAMYEVGTKQYEESQRRIIAIQREAAAQSAAVAEIRITSQRQAMLAEIALQEQAAQADLQLGFITRQQHLQLQTEFENKRFEIARAALQERLQLIANDPDKNPVEYARITAEIEQIEREHKAKISQIQGAVRTNQFQPLADIFRSSEQAIGQSINGILSRTMTMRGAMINAYQGMAKGMMQALTEYMAKRAAAWLVERGMTMLGIGADAAKAGTGAAASQASIPIIGPMLAVGAMAAIFAAVSAMSSKVPSHSASGGFDIGKFSMPLVQTHPEEMILPATLSNTVRDMAQVYAQTRGPSSGAVGGDVHVNVRGVPVGEFFLMHQTELVKALKTAQRRFAI